jgi:carboxylate-amine ligase
MQTLRQVGDHARKLGAGEGVQLLGEDAQLGSNDARWLRGKQARERLLAEVVRQGAQRFRGDA